jgi:hypothetical protein
LRDVLLGIGTRLDWLTARRVCFGRYLGIEVEDALEMTGQTDA